MAKALGSVPDMVIRSIFPWCLTPELYPARPGYVRSLADFVRSRPAQPFAAFLQQSNAVLARDVSASWGKITAPTLVTFGGYDVLTSARFADPITCAIPGSELLIFEGCLHTPIYEKVDELNQRTLAFLQPHAV